MQSCAGKGVTYAQLIEKLAEIGVDEKKPT
jgi:hypothetical protein